MTAEITIAAKLHHSAKVLRDALPSITRIAEIKGTNELWAAVSLLGDAARYLDDAGASIELHEEKYGELVPT